MEISLQDQVAFVTGAGAGIGEGAARRLAACGATVVVTDVERERADQVAATIVESGGRAVPLRVDVMDTSAIEAAMHETQRRFGRLDILVNNAGGVRGQRFLEQSERSWRRHIDINMVSMLAATWHGAHLMEQGGRGGSIVNVSSIEGSRAAPMYSVYAACKAAMLNFTRTMALELAEHGIRVNAITPDQTRTAGNSGQRRGPIDPEALTRRTEEQRDDLAAYVPVGREGTTEECGDVIAFLCSSQASYVTGVTLPVDGGAWASSGWIRRADGDGWTLGGGVGVVQG
jgi:NAD(P)-dependent dehydrogenase (short-subunit alcohol dehydrogenase family)